MEPTQTAAFRWSFLVLTLSICAWMLVAPHLSDRWIVQLLLQLWLINSIRVTLLSNPQWPRMHATMIGLWIVSLIGAALALAPIPHRWHQWARTAENLSVLPLLLLLAVGILRFVFTRRRLDTDGIFATIAVYMLIALLFSQLYLLLLEWNPASFSLPVAAAERTPQLLQGDMMYFSMITLATVGYGDLLPASETARTVAVLEAVVGQFYVAVIVAVFVGMFAGQGRVHHDPNAP